jgi:hypothetical protein
MTNASFEPLTIVLGEELSAVTFVADYVQLWFDGPCLSAYSLPIVSVGGMSYRWGEPGYRDALCGCIGKRVASTEYTEKERIRLDLSDGSSILMSLRSGDYEGPEAATLTDRLVSPTRWVVF